MDVYERAVDLSSYLNLPEYKALALLRSGKVTADELERCEGDFGEGRDVVARQLCKQDR